MTWPPEGAELVLRFTVFGEARTAGSKVSGVATRWDPQQGKRVPVMKGGKFVTFTKDSSGEKGKSWRGDIRDAALEAFGEREPLDRALALEVVTFKRRPKSHYRTGRNAHLLRDAAPSHPQGRPDVLKIGRALEDALSKLVWSDDARVVDSRHTKRWTTGRDRVEVGVWLMPAALDDGDMGGQETLLDSTATGNPCTMSGETELPEAEVV